MTHFKNFIDRFNGIVAKVRGFAKTNSSNARNSTIKPMSYMTGYGHSIGVQKESFEAMRRRAVDAQFE